MARLHQVFVGCPFANEVRKVYDRFKREVEAETPLSIVLADTVGVSSSDYLLESITELIRDSAGCIFDATGGNPNVSLEVGIAHTVPVDFMLTLKTRQKRTRVAAAPSRISDVRPIISDLQGRNRIEYKAFSSLKRQLVERYLPTLPYMKRWHQFKQDHRDMAPHALKLFADLRTSGRSTAARLAAILEGSGFALADVSEALRKSKLILVQRGRTGGYFYPSK